MKHLFLFAGCILLAFSSLGNRTFDKLSEVNKCWQQQTDVGLLNYPPYADMGEPEWIRLHLTLVEQTLRCRNVDNLSQLQKTNRLKALDHLHEYWLAGRYPQNEKYDYRTPIFIDDHDNFCAVGYLVKATGFEAVSRKIAANTNLAYVHDMQYPELFSWAEAYGFTIDELAWIQPGYSGNNICTMVGKGVSGVVHELNVDGIANRLYVGGEFKYADSSLPANNIAYITQASATYTWHTLGAGVKGTVKAIQVFNGQVFVAGNIDSAGDTKVENVAYWDGSEWYKAGCINGTINDLVVYHNDLYAAGSFGTCGGGANINFAKWDGINWVAIPGMSGNINTVEVYHDDLLLGGSFSYNGNSVNVISWNDVTGLNAFSNAIQNEVNDFEIYDDSVFAFCSKTVATDSMLVHKLYGNVWRGHYKSRFYANGIQSFKAACVNYPAFLAVGNFHTPVWPPTPMSTSYFNCTPIYVPGHMQYAYDYFNMDSTINKMVLFNGNIFVGGVLQPFNGIARRSSHYAVRANIGGFIDACEETGGVLTAKPIFGYPPLEYLWSNGDTTQSIQNLEAGQYWVAIKDATGKIDTATMSIRHRNIDTTVLVSVEELTTKWAGKTYQWINCDNDSLLIGEIYQKFQPKTSGNYAVIIGNGLCFDTSACYAISLNVEDVKQSLFTIYPNPTTNNVILNFGAKVMSGHITISDITGKAVLNQKITTSNRSEIDVSRLHAGLYTISVSDDDGNVVNQKLTKL